MPAEKRWPHKQNVQFSDEQWDAVHALAASQKTSFASIVRELIDLGLTVKATQNDCRQCPKHCQHEGVTQ